VNLTRFPKENHLPDGASRGNKVRKGDRVQGESVEHEPVVSVWTTSHTAAAEDKRQVHLMDRSQQLLMHRSLW
jgi:hypothetical protein